MGSLCRGVTGYELILEFYGIKGRQNERLVCLWWTASVVALNGVTGKVGGS